MARELYENNIFVLTLNSKMLYVVGGNLSNVDAVRRKISDLAKEYKMSIRQMTVKEYNDAKNSEYMEGESARIFTSLIMIILSVFGIMSISAAKLLSKRREIVIRLSFGTSKRGIIFIFSGELFILFVISLLITLLIHNISIINKSEMKKYFYNFSYGLNIQSVGVLLGIIVLIFIFSCIVPIITIKKFSLRDLIGGYE